MIEEWAWELRKISYSEPSWEKWQEMFHKSTASGDTSYNTAYRDVMQEMLKGNDDTVHRVVGKDQENDDRRKHQKI